MRASLLRWSGILGGYLATQGTIQVINLTTGVLILRFLPVEQYALYVIAMMLVTVVSIASDMGVSHGVTSLGASVRDQPEEIGSLILAALWLRRLLFGIVLPLVVGLAVLLFWDYGEYWRTLCIVVVLVLAVGWGQQTVSILSSVANINHDLRSLGFANGLAAIVRLGLVATACAAIPLATTAIATNLLGTVLSAAFLKRRVGAWVANASEGTRISYLQRLKTFCVPLAPGIVYYLLQGNIATAILWFVGSTISVAEVGALGRLGQIIGLLTLLNGFFFLPYFARIALRSLFLRRLAQVLLLLACFCAVVTTSTFLAPDWWLIVLGPSYSDLSSELLVAILGAQLNLVGSVLYTICIARTRTRGQWWQIILGVTAQSLFIATNGVSDTMDALLFNMLPAGTYLLLQAILLERTIREWK